MKIFYEKYRLYAGIIGTVIFLLGSGYGIREGVNSWINGAIDIKLNKKDFQEFITEQRMKEEKKAFRDSCLQANQRFTDSVENYYQRKYTGITDTNIKPAWK